MSNADDGLARYRRWLKENIAYQALWRRDIIALYNAPVRARFARSIC
jgi:hypothetical protein